VEAGGLLGYGVNFPGFYRRAAFFIDRILKGAKPGDIPIERATRFELIVNLKTAKALGVKIPQTLLQRADRVIE
jgi:putative ABC transport system substrate-binding protein